MKPENEPVNDSMKLEEEFSEKFCPEGIGVLSPEQQMFNWFKAKLDEKDKEIERLGEYINIKYEKYDVLFRKFKALTTWVTIRFPERQWIAVEGSDSVELPEPQSAIKYMQNLEEEIITLKSQLEQLKKGENDWWRKRWINNDAGIQLENIRKEFKKLQKDAYECAELNLKTNETWHEEIKKLRSQLAEREKQFKELSKLPWTKCDKDERWFTGTHNDCPHCEITKLQEQNNLLKLRFHNLNSHDECVNETNNLRSLIREMGEVLKLFENPPKTSYGARIINESLYMAVQQLLSKPEVKAVIGE